MYYIYRITNKINLKTYIGQHKYKELNDKYMGSGVNIRRAIGKAEYNIADGGGECAEHNTSEETKRKMSESHKGKAPWNKGKK